MMLPDERRPAADVATPTTATAPSDPAPAGRVAATEAAVTACPACGGMVSTMASSCVRCGHPLAGRRPVNPLAVASLVFSLLFLAGIGSLAGVVLGHLSISDIKKSRGSERGRGLAVAALVIGYVGLALVGLALLAVILFDAPDPQQVTSI